MPQIVYTLSTDPLAAEWRRDFETTEQRDEFVGEHTPPIWWYYFPEDDDWRRGPAWHPPKPDKVEATSELDEDNDRW